MGRIFINVDNTLARTRQALDTFERLYEPRFFSSLSPYANMVDAVNEIIEREKTDVFFVTNAPREIDCFEERKSWIFKYFPKVSSDNIVTYPTELDMVAYIPLGVMPDDILVADYNKSLNAWRRRGGIGVKFVGEFVYKSEARDMPWRGFSTKYTDPPSDIVAGLEALSVCDSPDYEGRYDMSLSDVAKLHNEYGKMSERERLSFCEEQDQASAKTQLFRAWCCYDISEKRIEKEGDFENVCKTIHKYEASVRRTPRRCFTNHKGVLKRGISKQLALKFGEFCKEYLHFGKVIEKAEEGTALFVRRTPELLVSLGCSDEAMHYTARHLHEALQVDGKHPMSVVDMKKMPELLADPVAIWRVPEEKGDRLVLLSAEKNLDGDPYIAVVEPFGTAVYAGKPEPSNFIVSFYARTQIYEDLKTAAAEKRFLWYNVARLDRLLFDMGFRLPRGISYLYSEKILDKIDRPPNPIETDLSEKKSTYREPEKETLLPVKNTTQKTAAQVGAVKRGAKKI